MKYIYIFVLVSTITIDILAQPLLEDATSSNPTKNCMKSSQIQNNKISIGSHET